ncbi:MAG: hypothetical protein ACR2OU_11400, partial [Thermomicrobiales bacterium]
MVSCIGHFIYYCGSFNREFVDLAGILRAIINAARVAIASFIRTMERPGSMCAGEASDDRISA